MTRAIALALALGLTTSATVAWADGGGPAHIDLEKAKKKGEAVTAKAGAATDNGIEFHVQSKKEGNAVVGFKVYLYDATAGTPLKSLTDKVICNPCEATVGGNTDVLKMNLDSMFAEKGGFPKATPNAVGLVIVNTDTFTDVSFSQVTSGSAALQLETLFITQKDFDKSVE